MRSLRPRAGDEGAQPLDPVGEAVLDQEVERAVDHRRLPAQPRLAQPVQELVGRHRPVGFEQRLQREGPGGRQPQPAIRADLPGRRQRLAAASRMVVRPEGRRIGA